MLLFHCPHWEAIKGRAECAWEWCVYLFSRGSWKISCQTEKSPLFWSFNPTHMELTLCWSKCFCPRLYRNCTHLIKQSHILNLTSFKKAHISLTCNVLMQERMSLSVFSHRAIRVPVSAFIPWRRVIYTIETKAFMSLHSCLWNHLVSMWVHVCVTSDSLWAKREGRVWGKANRKACCLSGLRAGT